MRSSGFKFALLGFSLFLMPAVAQSATFRASRSNVVGGEIISRPNLLSRSTVRLTILLQEGERGICTGSLLNDSVVLTAAHCLSDGPTIVRIDFFGSAGLQEYRFGTRYLVHEDYLSQISGDQARNDLALLAFDGGIPEENKPAYLYSGDIPGFSRDKNLAPKISIAGYGLSSPTGELDDLLRSARLQLGERLNDCVELKPMDHVASGCSGDSGGPAFVEIDGVQFLWGVASYVTAPYCQASTYYTNLALFREWKTGAMNRLLSAPSASPPPLNLLDEATVSEFLTVYFKIETDAARVKAIREWVRTLKMGAGIHVAAAMEILMAFDVEGSRLEGYLALSPRIRFDSLRQGQTFLYLFDDPKLRAEAQKTLLPLGIGYLLHD